MDLRRRDLAIRLRHGEELAPRVLETAPLEQLLPLRQRIDHRSLWAPAEGLPVDLAQEEVCMLQQLRAAGVPLRHMRVGGEGQDLPLAPTTGIEVAASPSENCLDLLLLRPLHEEVVDHKPVRAEMPGVDHVGDHLFRITQGSDLLLADPACDLLSLHHLGDLLRDPAVLEEVACGVRIAAQSLEMEGLHCSPIEDLARPNEAELVAFPGLEDGMGESLPYGVGRKRMGILFPMLRVGPEPHTREVLRQPLGFGSGRSRSDEQQRE